MPALNIDRADFLRDEDIVIFEDSAAKFLDERAPPGRVEKWREAGIVERAMWREAGEAGLLCLAIPEAYGGAGGDFRHEVVLMEQIARKEVSGFSATLHNAIVAPYILHYGSEEQ
jgi:acyl-CoA dehydrogenase